MRDKLVEVVLELTLLYADVIANYEFKPNDAESERTSKQLSLIAHAIATLAKAREL